MFCFLRDYPQGSFATSKYQLYERVLSDPLDSYIKRFSPFHLMEASTNWTHLLTRLPYRVGPKAGEVSPEDARKPGPSGVHLEGTWGALLGPALDALGPAS